MEPLISARTMILWALMEGEAFGLEVRERIEKRGAQVPEGTLYPTLRRLEREGLLRARDAAGPAARGGRPRVYYKLTADGARAARAAQVLAAAWVPA